MYYVYILKLCDGSYYKGQTENLEQRLSEHNCKKVKSTKTKLPFKLLHVEICWTRDDAVTMEKYFKSGYGREIIREIDAEVVEW